MEEVKAWKPCCCNKAFFHKSSAKRHEKKCYRNPNNKACLTCGNFVTDYNTVYIPPHGNQNYGDADYEERYNYCDHDKYIIRSDLDKKGRKPFQNKCKDWKPKEDDRC